MNKRSYSDRSSELPYKRSRPTTAAPNLPYQNSSYGPPSSGLDWSHLTEAIKDHSQYRHQSPDLFHRKQLLRDALFTIAKDIFPYCGLFIVGSSLNGFGSSTSDMDLCLMVSHVELDQKQEATRLLAMLHKAFRKLPFLEELKLIRAKVPILKFRDRISVQLKYFDAVEQSNSSIECDLNVNNSIGIRNTHLLNAYSQLDPRVAPLVQFVKFWAKHQNINDASQGTISSYSLSLMVLHYLQCGCIPSAVPSLQLMYPEVFNPDQDIRLLSLDKKLPAYLSENHNTLGELFYGFLGYFANNFDFEMDAISVRLGKKLAKDLVMNQNTARNPPSQWKFLCIEEPFDLSNTARSVFDHNTFQRIFYVIRRSWEILKTTRNIDRVIKEPV